MRKNSAAAMRERCSLSLHAAAGIEDQAHGDRFVVHGELRDRLLHLVFEEAEVFLLQAGDGAVQLVVDGDRHQHQVRIHAQIGTGRVSGCGPGARNGALRNRPLCQCAQRKCYTATQSGAWRPWPYCTPPGVARGVTMSHSHVLFPLSLGLSPQPADPGAGGAPGRGRARPRSHGIQSDARGPASIRRKSRAALADPRLLAYEPAPAGALAAREAVSGLLSLARARRYRRAHSAHGQHQRGLRVSVQAAGRIRATRCWCRGPPIRCSSFWPTMESVQVRQYPLAYHGGWAIDLRRARGGDHAADARDRPGESQQPDRLLS